MKIFIDSTWYIIYEWVDGKCDRELYRDDFDYGAYSFQKIVDEALTIKQQQLYVSGDSDKVWNLSKKKELALKAAIKKATE